MSFKLKFNFIVYPFQQSQSEGERHNPLTPSFHSDGVMGLGGISENPENPLKNDQNTDVFLTFDLTVRSPSLRIPPYSEYQQLLYDTIIELQNKGLNLTQIADWLNENGYQTPRGHTFKNNHVHSIVKKKRIRTERLSKTYPSEMTNLGIRFVDKSSVDTS